jgi:hypothetical protein
LKKGALEYEKDLKGPRKSNTEELAAQNQAAAEEKQT